MKKSHLKLSDEDKNCLLLLWRWKLLTTAALRNSTYTQRSNYRTYCRLIELEKFKYIKCVHSVDRWKYVWQLDELGYEIIKDGLPILKMNGYLSENKSHDFWVTAIHLGEWLEHLPANSAQFSEQELRRYDFESYPSWVPKTSTHRPDGWWKTNVNQSDKESLIALEVELSKKSSAAYIDVGEFYSTVVQPYQVIWVVPTVSDIKYIFSHLKSGSKSNCAEQSFITLDQYVQHQWQSKIQSGKNIGKSLLEILGKSSGKSTNSLSSIFLLDTHKCPTESIPSRILQTAEIGLNR